MPKVQKLSTINVSVFSADLKLIGFENRSKTYPQLTDHYFTGDYPVKLIDDLGDSKVTQLSLLSTKSNN